MKLRMGLCGIKYAIFLIIILQIFILSGCSKNKESSFKSISENNKHFISINKKNKIKSINKYKNLAFNKNEVTIYYGANLKKFLNEGKALKAYLKTIQKENVAQIIETDINNDKCKELIVSFGRMYDNSRIGVFNCNYVIQMRKKQYFKIAKLSTYEALIIYVDAVKLDNSNNLYIYLERSNGDGGIGRIIYGFKNGRLNVIEDQIPPMGKGECILVKDKNTKIFKAVDIKICNDIQQHEIYQYYIWDGSKFKQSKREVKYFSEDGNGKFIYPNSPENLIQCYLESIYIKFYSESKLMQYDNNVGTINVGKYFSPHGEFELHTKLLKFEQISKSKEMIKYKVSNSGSKKYALVEIVKENQKWKIRKVKCS